MAAVRIFVVDYVGDNMGDILTILSSFLSERTEAPRLGAERETEHSRTQHTFKTPSLTEPIDVLQLVTRWQNCLTADGIHTVGELVACTAERLEKCQNLGPVGIKSVMAALTARGLSLRK